MTTYRVTPSDWADEGFDHAAIDRMVGRILVIGPHHVTVGDFDQHTAAAIADRLVATGICPVHVEGSGFAQWPTPGTIYRQLIDRIASR